MVPETEPQPSRHLAVRTLKLRTLLAEWILSSTRKIRRASSCMVLRNSQTNPRVPAMAATGTTRPRRAGLKSWLSPRPCTMAMWRASWAAPVVPAQSRWLLFRKAKLTTASRVLCGRKSPRPPSGTLERRGRTQSGRHKNCSGSCQTQSNRMQRQMMPVNLDRCRRIRLVKKSSRSFRWHWVTGSH
jgi:hypothetical protein